jgi:hypothetical protein
MEDVSQERMSRGGGGGDCHDASAEMQRRRDAGFSQCCTRMILYSAVLPEPRNGWGDDVSCPCSDLAQKDILGLETLCPIAAATPRPKWPHRPRECCECRRPAPTTSFRPRAVVSLARHLETEDHVQSAGDTLEATGNLQKAKLRLVGSCIVID